MDNHSYIEVMIQSLKKKKQILDAVLQKSLEQNVLMQNENLDVDDFDRNVKEKAALIDELTLLDDGFEQIYEKIKEELDMHREKYKEEILTLKQLIREVTNQSVAIQAQENRNKQLVTQKFSTVRKQIKEIRSSQKVVNQYYQNMQKLNYIDPQFMDNKK